MTDKNQPRKRRRRGIILTLQGLNKLTKAKSQAEFKEKRGDRFTLEDLSERTGLVVDTITKVFACEAGVDKQTLKCCFRAFDLVLESGDYYQPNLDQDTILTKESLKPELPEGQVPLDSSFYIERPPIEAECYQAILQPGALIRIKAPRRMGKTSLIARIIAYAAQHHYQTVHLSLRLVDREIFQSLDKFLQWFCANVSLSLQLPNAIANCWDEIFGSKISCKMYFEQYLLTQIEQPLVLSLDEVDWVFQYPALADDFFGLLRTWHEEGKNREIWQKLRLVVGHSIEVYIPLNVNKSPFNVGLPIELPQFTPSQIEDLAQRHGLNLSPQQVAQLMSLVGGQPYLVRLTLYHLWHQDISLTELEQVSLTSPGIYGNHLQRQLWNLQQEPELAIAYNQVINSSVPVELDLIQALKLQSIDLVHLQGSVAVPSCELYRRYFSDYFSSNF